MGRKAGIEKGRPFFSWRDHGVIDQIDLGVETSGQHALVLADELAFDADILELQAGQGGDVRVGLGVEPRREQVDDLDRAALSGAGLEEFLLTAADGSVAELPLDDLQPLLDLVLVHAGAVTAQEELADVGRDGVLPRRTSAPGPCGR